MSGIPGWGKGIIKHVVAFRGGGDEYKLWQFDGPYDRNRAAKRREFWERQGRETKLIEIQVLGEVKEGETDAG